MKSSDLARVERSSFDTIGEQKHADDRIKQKQIGGQRNQTRASMQMQTKAQSNVRHQDVYQMPDRDTLADATTGLLDYMTGSTKPNSMEKEAAKALVLTFMNEHDG